ncbi:MAG: YjbH domain-containing protein, partial [Candidatus Zipacnadales bacterium]
RPTEPVAPHLLAERLLYAVCAVGMENVRTEVGGGPAGPAAVVFYENRRYVHDELEALGRVLAVAVQELPADIARLTVIATKSQVPVLQVTVCPDDYVRFVAGDLSPARFGEMLEVGHSGTSPIPPDRLAAKTGLAHPTRHTLDIAITPVIRTLIGAERPTPSDPNATESLAVRFSLRPDLYMNVGRGLDLRYSHGVHIAGALGAAIDPYFAADAAYASYFWQPFEEVLGRLAVGDFLGHRRGGIAEGVVGLDNDQLLLRGVAGYLTDRRFFDTRSGHWFGIGDIRYRLPSLDLTACGTFGRYLDDDVGFTVGLRKYFGDTELHMQFRHSAYGEVILLAGTMPVGPASWSRAVPVRLRLADRVQFGQRALLAKVGEVGLVTTASLVANSPEDFDLADTLLNRDRLNASYIRAHLDTLIPTAAVVKER